MNEPRETGTQRPLDAHKLLREVVADAAQEKRVDGWQPPAIEELAGRFPELSITELVGRGGMGAVYRAEQNKIARTVALKVLPAELAADASFEERFLREGRALASLEHARILTVYDFGERDGVYYLLTEFVEGMNLRELMDLGELSPQEALRIAPQICEALQFAHDHGVVHRDIKPENVLIDADGNVRIADFGLARIVDDGVGPALTRSTQVLGTPHYMAPEQWSAGKSVDHRADIYSVGVVIYEMLTGQLPLGHFEPPSNREGVPRGLDAVVRRTLAQRPESRYQRVGEVGEALERQSGRATGAERRRHRSDVRVRSHSFKLLFATCFAIGMVLWLFYMGVLVESGTSFTGVALFLAVTIGLSLSLLMAIGHVAIAKMRAGVSVVDNVGGRVIAAWLLPLLTLTYLAERWGGFSLLVLGIGFVLIRWHAKSLARESRPVRRRRNRVPR